MASLLIEEGKCTITSKVNAVRILHVDDDPCILDVTKAILSSEGNYEVETALSVDEAQKKLAIEHYDAIVSDYEMPQKNGLQFLRELRQQNDPTPFILFTGKGREEVAIKALNLGADGYVNKQGNPETVYGELAHSMQNAVARRHAEIKARESEHFTQKIVDSTPNLIYIYDLMENSNIYANKEVTDFLGYSTAQVRAMGSRLFANILHPDDMEIVAAHHRRFANAPDNAVFEVEYRMKHSDGEWRWLHSRDVLFGRTKEGIGSQILGSCWDVTKQKEAELELKQRFELLERVGENIGSGLAIIDRNYRVVWANQVLSNAGAKAGRKCFECIARVSEVCADCGSKKIFEENLPLHVHDYRATLPNGETNWVEIRVTPLKDKQGKIIAALELAVPINDRKKAEEKSIASRLLVQAINEKLRVVGSLTRHDIGNKLTAMKAQTYLLRKQIGSDPKLAGRIDTIDSLIGKCSELFEFSRIFERIGDEELSKANLSVSFDEAVKLYGKQEIEFTDTCQGVTVIADSLLQQLFYQLIDNSVKHGKNVTKIKLKYIQDDDKTRIIYEDNGIGIPQENKKKIFTEGFTTGGSGLGLKLVKKMVDAYGWTIAEDGQPSKGATFVITIPKESMHNAQS